MFSTVIHASILVMGAILTCRGDQHHVRRRDVTLASTVTHPVYSCLITLSKPGEGCDLHPAYPNTIQCAETRRCIAFSQFKDGKCDCCGPEVDCHTCFDHSDENRVACPGDPTVCEKHPHFSLGMTFQCAIRRDICLSKLTDWNNARCDCCPEVKGDCCHPNCTDHSDEECMAHEWDDKFTCDGNCISVDKLNDSTSDCSFHCVETNKAARNACEIARKPLNHQIVENVCNQMIQGNIPYYRCPTGSQRCIDVCNVLDGKPDCDQGEDEDTTLHQFCNDTVKAAQCKPGTFECISVEKGKQYFCRCARGSSASCKKDQ